MTEINSAVGSGWPAPRAGAGGTLLIYETHPYLEMFDPSSNQPLFAVIAIVGAGVATGLLFAFSHFVMRALADLSVAHGMFAMQRINQAIINPIFLLFFFARPIACVPVIATSFAEIIGPGEMLLMAGAIAYLVGPLGIAMFFNVPLNNKLAAVVGNDAAQAWSKYQKRWQSWNHIRTYIGILSILFLAAGLSAQ